MLLEINNINLINLKDSNGLMLNSSLTLKQFSMKNNDVVMSKPLKISLDGEIRNVFEQPEFLGKLELGTFKVETKVVSAIGFENLALTDIAVSAQEQSLGLLELNGLVVGDSLFKLQRYEVRDINLNNQKISTGIHEFSGLKSVIELTQTLSIYEVSVKN